jgi:hypothetical protein
LEKVENLTFDGDYNTKSFAGTDNGIATMMETAGFNFQQYQFHLNLYNNYYAVLEKGMSLETI